MNFTRALYLGLTHQSEHLRWTQLTTGTPAAVNLTAQARAAAEAFAALVGCERAVAMTSSLHAFVDLFGSIARAPSVVIHDECLYPVARWAIERVERRRGRVLSFRHHDAEALEQKLVQARPLLSARQSCWVVSDGYCPGCAEPAPLRAYATLAERYGGRLMIDDTQSVGLLGRAPSAAAPYGLGGGGSLARWGLCGADVVVVASLAKAFGAPLAMVAGRGSFVDAFVRDSEALVHCSPPSEANLAAALRALAINERQGDALRARLAARVRTFRRALRSHGFTVHGGLFPVQRVAMKSAAAATALQAALGRHGIEAVVHRVRCTQGVSLAFIVTAGHGEADLRDAASALAAAARGCRELDTKDTFTLEA